MSLTIAVHLASGFEEIEAVCVIDVLRRAGLDVKVVSVTGKYEVTGAHQIQFVADILFEQMDYSDVYMIVLPGGMPGTANLDAHEGLKECIRDFYTQGKFLAAICAAPFILGNIGILNGKQAVCYPGYESQLIGSEVLTVPVVQSGNIITGRGVGCALDFALKIVEQAVSKEKADLLAAQMLISA